MGYYTKYNLTVNPEITDSVKFKEYFEELTTYPLYCVTEYGEAIKWYDYHDNMIKISKQYPETVFCLRGDGEEKGDIWQTFYKNGLSYSWKMSTIDYPKFDESKLK